MLALLLSVLTLSSAETPAHAAPTGPSCAYEFDITRAQEPAPSGCPVARWGGDPYDATAIQPSFSSKGGALQAFRSAPAPGDGSAWI